MTKIHMLYKNFNDELNIEVNKINVRFFVHCDGTGYTFSIPKKDLIEVLIEVLK